MNEELIRILVTNDLQFNKCRSFTKLVLNVFAKSGASITANDVGRVIGKMLIAGEIFRLEYHAPTSPEVEVLYFLKGTRILNMEEVIANQRSLELGEESNRDKEIPSS